MKVSIVTISFNQVEFLGRAMDSVLNQDHPDLEYIVVDPGSTDGSRELIQQYGSKIARTVFEKDNGPADGLNKGFSLATGSVLGFLNSDDILYPGAISQAVKYLAKHPEIDVVSGHANVIGPHDEVLRRAYSDHMSLKRYVYGGIALIQPSTFFRSSAFQRVGGFNPENRAVWDGELFCDMARMGSRFAVTQQIWSGYRLHSSSITATMKMEQRRLEAVAAQFRKVMGRNPNGWDKFLRFYFRWWRHLTNPRDTMERLFRGPIYGRVLN